MPCRQKYRSDFSARYSLGRIPALGTNLNSGSAFNVDFFILGGPELSKPLSCYVDERDLVGRVRQEVNYVGDHAPAPKNGPWK
jgi:hypothetical protein